MKKTPIIIGIIIILGLVGFFGRDFLAGKFSGLHQFKKETLRIVLSDPATDISEKSHDLNNLMRSANIYEGLVAFDKNLKIIPSLAVSWGNTDALTWEFKLRKGVVFHDKSKFDAESVKQSFESDSFKDIRKNAELKIKDNFTIRITTKKPDPLMLSVLTKAYIARPEFIGTGPYKLKKWDNGKSVYFTAFLDYWGKLPSYKDAEYLAVEDKNKRKSDFNNGLIDILAAVPNDQALTLSKDQIKTNYSLEVNFLMFKLDDPVLADIGVRRKIAGIFDPAKIEEIGSNFVRRASQFIAPGVYGYNPDIVMPVFDESLRARNIFGQRREKLTLDFPPSYRTLAEYLKKQLSEAGFIINLNAAQPDALLKKIKSNRPQIFLSGWHSENGDAGGFFDAFIESGGEFNGGRYKDAAVDDLILKSRYETDPQKRLEVLQRIGKMIHNDVIGVPLFESSRIYAVKKGILWQPRMDGLVLARDVK